ncbi:LAFA_0B01486g1_1 [Lachancea sp. 'fantastica']|nr:LAFA_0B01486g1_1 [Lachancea sp. 'fantastica']
MAPALIYKSGSRGLKHGLLRSLAITFGPSTNITIEEQEGATEPSSASELIQQLSHKDNGYELRKGIATELLDLIEELPAESVLKVWNGANDLVERRVPHDAREVALKLLRACLKRLAPNMNGTLVLAFYHSLMRSNFWDCEDTEAKLNVFIDCLSTLTNGGTRFYSLLTPHGDVSGLDEFLRDTLARLGTRDFYGPVITTKTLEFVANCVESGLFLSIESMEHITLIANKSAQDSVRRSCLTALAMATHEVPAPSKALISDEIRSLVEMQNREDHVEESLLPILNLLFLGRNAHELIQAFLRSNKKDTSRVAYFIVFIELLTQEQYKQLWNHPDISAERVGQLLATLMNSLYIQKDSSENASFLILGAMTQLLQSDTFLAYMLDFPSFWIGDNPNSSDCNAFRLLGLVLKTKRLSDLSKKRVHSIFERLVCMLATNNMRYLGFRDFLQALPHIFDYCELLDTVLISQLLDLLSENIAVAVKWQPFFTTVISKLYVPQTLSTTRIQVLKLIQKAAKEAFCQDENTRNLPIQSLQQLLSNYETEEDESVVIALTDLYSSACKYFHANAVENLNEKLMNPAFAASSGRRRSSGILFPIGSTSTSKRQRNKQIILATASAKLATWSMAFRPADLFVCFYRVLIQIVEYAYRMEDTDLYLIPARVLTKIQCRGDDGAVLAEVNEIEGISTALGKNSKFNGFCKDSKWSFPEDIDYLHEAQQKCFIRDAVLPKFEKEETVLGSSKINIRLWLSVAILTLEKPFDWEVYSYVLTYMCPQFANLIPLRPIDDMALRYQEVICNHLKHGAGRRVKIPKFLYTDDLHVAYIRSLSSILGYHRFAPKSFADGITDSLHHGMQATEKTLTPSLNLLTICSHEIPASLKRFLTPILVQLQTRITSPFSTPAILEFLLALSDTPTIISHLTLDEVKRVFAIAFKLIESSKDLKMRAQIKNVEQHISYAEQDAEYSPSSLSFTITPSMAHFFLTLSYNVISNWFLRMSSSNRTELAPFVVKSLRSMVSGGAGFDFDAHAYLDLVARFTTSRNDSTLYSRTFKERTHEEKDEGGFSFGTWVMPDKIVTIETHKQTGDSTVIVRSSSGADTLNLRLVRPEVPKTYDIFSIGSEDAVETNSNDTIDCFFTAAYTLMRVVSFAEAPVRVPDNGPIARSIQLFDTIPYKDLHKIGLFYVGPQQCQEAEILANTSGSFQYKTFLSRLGRVIRLDASTRLYLGGLEPVTDGHYALVWGDEKTQVVFHTVTLMPNNSNDEQLSLKKRHVGNDFVNIFYDESGLPGFDFNIVRSQFNFINIVINPLEEGRSDLFKVRMYRKSGVPAFFSSSHFKIMTSMNLAKYIRQVSIIADTFASSWFATTAPEVCTTWARRAEYLRGINEKLGATEGQQHLRDDFTDFTKNI